jgi:hypothetical protein
MYSMTDYQKSPEQHIETNDLIYDENHKLVTFKALADRYRRETRPRPVKGKVKR